MVKTETDENIVNEKVLILVTTQQSAMHLMDFGYALAQAKKSEMHVLHIQKGGNVFGDESMLQSLSTIVNYATKLGACIHLQCEEHVAEYIAEFVAKEKIETVVMGESATEIPKGIENEKEKILALLPDEANVIVVPRKTKIAVG